MCVYELPRGSVQRNGGLPCICVCLSVRSLAPLCISAAVVDLASPCLRAGNDRAAAGTRRRRHDRSSAGAQEASSGAAKPEARDSRRSNSPLTSGRPNPASGIPLDEIGTSVSVVTGGDLAPSADRSCGRRLAQLTGRIVNRSGGPQSLTACASAVPRPATPGADRRRRVILSDGVFDFSNLMTEDIERVEVSARPAERAIRLRRPRWCRQRHHQTRPRPVDRARARRGRILRYQRRGRQPFRRQRQDLRQLLLVRHSAPTVSIFPRKVTRTTARSSPTLRSQAAPRYFQASSCKGTLRRSRVEGDRDDFDGFNAQGFNVCRTASRTSITPCSCVHLRRRSTPSMAIGRT